MESSPFDTLTNRAWCVAIVLMELCNQKAFTSKGALAVEECLEVIVIYTSSYDD